MRRIIALLMALPLLACAADINYTNIPFGVGVASTNTVLGETNGGHNVRVFVSDILNLAAGQIATSNYITSASAGDVFKGSNNIFTASNRFTGPLTISTTGSVAILDFPTNVLPANPPIGSIRTYAVTDNGFVQLENLTDLGIRNRLNQDVKRVFRNVQGSPITKGQAVYIFSGTGTRSDVKLARANSTSTMPAVAIATATVADSDFGEFMIVGKLVDLKTDYATWTEGNSLYVSADVAGTLTNVAPVYTNFAQFMGLVDFADPVNGILSINIKDMMGTEDGTVSQTFGIGSGTNMIGNSGTKLNGVGITNGIITGDLTGNAATATSAGTVTNVANDMMVTGNFTVSNSTPNGKLAYTNATGSLYATGLVQKFEAGGANTLVVTNGAVGIGKGNPSKTLDVTGKIAASSTIDGDSITATYQLYAGWGVRARGRLWFDSPAIASISFGPYTGSLTNMFFGDNNGSMPGATNAAIGHTPGTVPVLRVWNAANGPADLQVSGTLTATNGVIQMVKPSFTTNFTCTTNLQTYLLNGSGPQIVTLPNAANVPNLVYHFTTTNDVCSYILTNATGAQTIADGKSFSYTNSGSGKGVVSLMSDGAHWWLISKGKYRLPCAQFSTTTNTTFANITNCVTLQQTDLNNGLGIGLDNSAWFTAGVGSRIYCTNLGVYMLTISAIWSKTSGTADNGDIWLRQSGIDVPNSMTLMTIANSATNVMTVNYNVNVVTNNTFFDFQAASTGGAGILQSMPAIASPFNRPACPAVIVTVNKMSD